MTASKLVFPPLALSSSGAKTTTIRPISFSLFSPSQPPILFHFLTSHNANSCDAFIFSPPFAHQRCFLEKRSTLSSRQTWLCRYMGRRQDMDGQRNERVNGMKMFGLEDKISQVLTQGQSLVEGSGSVRVPGYKPVTDVGYLQELLAIQQQGPRAIGFFGARNVGFLHQEVIEILSFALVINNNHIFTSAAAGTNAAVIRGALRAGKPDLLTVILPQSLEKQPPESRELLSKVQNVIEKPLNDHLPLIEASRLCNLDIISHVQQVICFAFHDSKLLLETCQEAKNLRRIVTLFYLD